MRFLKVFGIVIGLLMAVNGYNEFKLARFAQAEASSVELRAVETGDRPPNDHLKIGDHLSVYPATVCVVTTKRGEKAGPDAQADWCWYPVVARDNPRAPMIGKSAGVSIEFAMLVKTRRYRAMKEIPGSVMPEGPVQGLVMNRIEGLRDDARALLTASFPGIDLDKVLILEEGRTPASPMEAIGLALVGVGLVAACGVWLAKS